MRTTPQHLLPLAVRVLSGLGLDSAEAARVAAGEQPATGAAADALRDGWTSAGRETRP